MNAKCLQPSPTSLLRSTVVLLLVLSPCVLHAKEPVAWNFWVPSNEAGSASIDHRDWQYILDTYLVADNPSGINLFAYGDVTTTDRDRLSRYINKLATTDPRKFSRAEQRAYWINLYNALTVALVIDFYPVESIREIHGGLFNSGPWDEKLIEIARQKLTLNDIEHRILRPVFRDPRTHYAINCASIGCPNLATQAYTKANMERLLDEGARAFINHPRGVSLADGRLQTSSIYKWFSVDFGASTADLIDHLLFYAQPELAKKLQSFNGEIAYAYDWQLNEP